MPEKCPFFFLFCVGPAGIRGFCGLSFESRVDAELTGGVTYIIWYENALESPRRNKKRQ